MSVFSSFIYAFESSVFHLLILSSWIVTLYWRTLVQKGCFLFNSIPEFISLSPCLFFMRYSLAMHNFPNVSCFFPLLAIFIFLYACSVLKSLTFKYTDFRAVSFISSTLNCLVYHVTPLRKKRPYLPLIVRAQSHASWLRKALPCCLQRLHEKSLPLYVGLYQKYNFKCFFLEVFIFILLDTVFLLYSHVLCSLHQVTSSALPRSITKKPRVLHFASTIPLVWHNCCFSHWSWFSWLLNS